MQKNMRSEKERRKQAEYELGRYKKKVANQQKVIDQLREEAVGYQQSIDMSFALVTAAVQHTGELSRIFQKRRLAVVCFDEERMTYTLRMMQEEASN